MRCEEKKNTSPQMQQQLKAGDGNEFKPFFFFYTVVQKKSEYLCLYSCPLRSYTQHSGEDHANSSTLYKNMSSFFI